MSEDIERMPLQPNVPLLRKVVEWAEAEDAKGYEESEWYQGTWRVEGEVVGKSCGTAYCIAGYVAQMVDERYQEDTIVDGKHASYVAAEALGLDALVFVDNDDETWATHDLFSGGNDITEIRQIAERVVGEAL